MLSPKSQIAGLAFGLLIAGSNPTHAHEDIPRSFVGQTMMTIIAVAQRVDPVFARCAQGWYYRPERGRAALEADLRVKIAGHKYKLSALVILESAEAKCGRLAGFRFAGGL